MRLCKTREKKEEQIKWNASTRSINRTFEWLFVFLLRNRLNHFHLNFNWTIRINVHVNKIKCWMIRGDRVYFVAPHFKSSNTKRTSVNWKIDMRSMKVRNRSVCYKQLVTIGEKTTFIFTAWAHYNCYTDTCYSYCVRKLEVQCFCLVNLFTDMCCICKRWIRNGK